MQNEQQINTELVLAMIEKLLVIYSKLYPDALVEGEIQIKLNSEDHQELLVNLGPEKISNFALDGFFSDPYDLAPHIR